MKTENVKLLCEKPASATLGTQPRGWRNELLPALCQPRHRHGRPRRRGEGNRELLPSLHLAWHSLKKTYFEIAKPIYMQSSIVVDWNKGGWTAPWESTGGPQQASGAKAFFFEVADEQPGFTVDAGTMTQCCSATLPPAARAPESGLNARQCGWEGGEFALLDRNEQVCERTIRSGEIAKAANAHRDELWEAVREPQVGILTDFANDAVWAMAVKSRTKLKYRLVEARIGANRACIDASVTYEHVTARDLEAGLASRYPVIYMPAFLGLNQSHLGKLQAYVEQGGRLVMDTRPAAELPGCCAAKC